MYQSTYTFTLTHREPMSEGQAKNLGLYLRGELETSVQQTDTPAVRVRSVNPCRLNDRDL